MCLTVLVGVEAFSDLLIDDVLDVETNGYVTIVSACLPCGIVVALFASPFVVQKYQPTLQQQQKFVIWSLVGIVVLAIAMLAWIWIFYQTSHTSDGIALTIMGILLFLYGLILGMFWTTYACCAMWHVFVWLFQLLCLCLFFLFCFVLFFSVNAM